MDNYRIFITQEHKNLATAKASEEKTAAAWLRAIIPYIFKSKLLVNFSAHGKKGRDLLPRQAELALRGKY